MSSWLRLGLQFSEQLPKAVREELEQLVAALQRSGRKVIPIEFIPDEDILIDASQIVSGQVATARGGTGIDGSGAGNGYLLIGNGAGFTLAQLTAGTGISITNGSGSISLAAAAGGGGRWEPWVTGGFGTPANSELVFGPTGDVVMVWVP